jgi:hypothetical protein
VSTRVSLTAHPPASDYPAGSPAAPPQTLLSGPVIVLGDSCRAGAIPEAIRPRADTLFGPRGACLVAAGGPLWICDTGHHRLLGWRKLPVADNTAADWVIGQPDFHREGRNGKRAADAASFNVPTGITAYGDGIAVADAWNHRVLIWRQLPQDSNTPADLVLGQEDFAKTDPNRGYAGPDADTLYWPYGIFADAERLFVADSQNRRLLIWNSFPQVHGQPADRVLGQTGFSNRDENAGGTANAMSMRWPHAITVWQGRLCVADAGNNRIMLWSRIPDENGNACDMILGQTQPALVDHNQSQYWPRADTLNMPYGITAMDNWLLVADTANSRLLGWHSDELATGTAARALTGQPDFRAKGDNRWQLPVRDSLCWPYALQACYPYVIVADSGNNRVQLWKQVL